MRLFLRKSGVQRHPTPAAVTTATTAAGSPSTQPSTPAPGGAPTPAPKVNLSDVNAVARQVYIQVQAGRVPPAATGSVTLTLHPARERRFANRPYRQTPLYDHAADGRDGFEVVLFLLQSPS
jgi:uncharacterized iron-regulated membrane protein